MIRWIMVPLALLLAGCNGVERDLAACKLEMLHSDARPAAQRAHVELCMRSRGWRFRVIDRCMPLIEPPGPFQSYCYVSDAWWWVK
jgi:hypothetical protein